MERWRFGGWGEDKWKHFLGGIGIALCVSLLLEMLRVPFPHEIGLSAAVIIGILKEVIYDWLMKKGTPEILDFLCTAAGGLVAFLIL